jgi:LAO/AO transport system kinase
MTDPAVQEFVDGVIAGDRRMLAKTITLIESTLPEHLQRAQSVLNRLMPQTGKAVRLGITGVPGVGKSTFIESFGMMLIEQGHRVAVLAIDPSSSRSGGSIMADKTRMERLSCRPEAFIRPSPSAGALGGVARKTRETMLACEAAGFDVIIVETVGVGQSETTVASMVDFFLVLMLAGAGDELQGIKRGVMELADAVAITKADGDNVAHAEKARKQYETALHLLTPVSGLWTPRVVTCSALTLAGVDGIWAMANEHRRLLTEAGVLERKRQEQALQWMWSLVEEGLKRRFHSHTKVRDALEGITRQVLGGGLTPSAAATRLLLLLDNH